MYPCVEVFKKVFGWSSPRMAHSKVKIQQKNAKTAKISTLHKNMIILHQMGGASPFLMGGQWMGQTCKCGRCGVPPGKTNPAYRGVAKKFKCIF